MLHKLSFLFLFISIQCFSQENKVFTPEEIYQKDGLIYKTANDSIFTGSIEFRRWTNNILLAKKDYKDGYIILATEYYNKSAKGIPSRKTYYYDHEYFKKKKTDRLDFDGTVDSTIYFDENGNKINEEFFSNGKLTFSCEYKDGKKNGKEFCLSKKGEEINSIYENGKKIK
ncbi:hypothetical protein GKZ90_0018095 [Flavobacterium sp. MC2016-06]|uniref:hypothetical protein n=1 Tax=Flavobacterium sp. MC2016-06 TaxID=2676308 RepID=UPI0012BA694A|nr:hypothetical protein [Flavobacterium sp. MC2016-06]MBU3858378.1 hypothetical protein [Flavobacterium sp. MC2016-06]